MHTRENALNKWLEKILGQTSYTLTPLTGDASFRRYYRLNHLQKTQVIMDAPPEKENLDAFIEVEHQLYAQGLRTPRIRAMDLNLGFLLLDDLGDRLLLNEPLTPYYYSALDTILTLQTIPSVHQPAFDSAFMHQEMSLFQTWFLEAYHHIELNAREQKHLNQLLKTIASHLMEQPSCFIHRDYHSRNLMLIEENNATHIGVIDFQDAMQGPFTYDLVSLLKDCYIQWPNTTRTEWVSYFYNHLSNTQGWSRDEFEFGFDWCGLQRHLKVLGVFCRLHLRDNKSNYIHDLPLTLKYAYAVSEQYDAFHPLLDILQKHILPISQDHCSS